MSPRFLNKGLNRIKLLRIEPGGLVLYSKILDSGRFYRPNVNNDSNIRTSFYCSTPTNKTII